jgi:hypothetical protein
MTLLGGFRSLSVQLLLSPHYSFYPVAFGQLHSDGVQFPNVMLTWAGTG